MRTGCFSGRSGTVRFAIGFVAVFAILCGAFEAARGTVAERLVTEDLLLRPTVRLINAVFPGEHVQLQERTLVSASSKLRVTRGCEGIETLLLLGAATLAYPASLRRRIVGLAVGCIVVYMLSVVRLIALHFTLRYEPSEWEVLHGLIAPLLPVIITGIYFLRWSSAGSTQSRAANINAA